MKNSTGRENLIVELGEFQPHLLKIIITVMFHYFSHSYKHEQIFVFIFKWLKNTYNSKFVSPARIIINQGKLINVSMHK